MFGSHVAVAAFGEVSNRWITVDYMRFLCNTLQLHILELLGSHVSVALSDVTTTL